MLENDWASQPIESERLYDVVFDSSEAHNLAGNPDYADVLAEMRERLEQWRTDTADPVDENQIMTPPETAVLNDPADVSPGDKRYPAAEIL